MNLKHAAQFTSFVPYFDKILMWFEGMIKKLFVVEMNYRDTSETLAVYLFVLYQREFYPLSRQSNF